jgi:hypothetical protein
MAGLVGLLINFVILIVIHGVVYWICAMIIGAMGMPWGDVAIKIIGVICLLVILLWFLSVLQGPGPLFYQPHGPVLR